MQESKELEFLIYIIYTILLHQQGLGCCTPATGFIFVDLLKASSRLKAVSGTQEAAAVQFL